MLRSKFLAMLAEAAYVDDVVVETANGPVNLVWFTGVDTEAAISLARWGGVLIEDDHEYVELVRLKDDLAKAQGARNEAGKVWSHKIAMAKDSLRDVKK